jgi:hypothetical protein
VTLASRGVAVGIVLSAGVAEAVPPSPLPRDCTRHEKELRTPRTGGSLEFTTGRQSSGFPLEGHAWGFGFDVRRRIARRIGLIARLDRTHGRDAGVDRDGDGRDDAGTGAVNRLSVLGGTTVTLSSTYYDDFVRFIELDLLAGYLATTSQPGEDGFAAGADLSFQLLVPRVGLRVVQGFGDAREARMVLAHVGINIGGMPPFAVRVGCANGDDDDNRGGSAWAVGFDLPLSGYALVGDLGYVTPGFAVETAYYLHPLVQAVARGDVFAFTNGDADRVVHQSLFAGGRIDLSQPRRSTRIGPSLVVLAGYSFASATEPTRAGSGPVLDASLGFGAHDPTGGVGLRLHGRFGLAPENADVRAVFLSLGVELRLDERRWRDRE